MASRMPGALSMASTACGTRPCGASRFTGMPPHQRMNQPSGPLNSVCLARKRTSRPMANTARMPTTKSQFEVCGATIATTFERAGKSPSILQPEAPSSVRDTALVNAFPRPGMPSGRTGTLTRRLGLLRRLVFGFLVERLPDRLEADEALLVRRHLARGQEARLSIRHFGGRLLGF